ncbi:MAG: hypothetical protein N2515_11020, partial [Deltaproteobacteria bacterium]|nr:hypothetical protein [Deltaproteobacteria bacterium]
PKAEPPPRAEAPPQAIPQSASSPSATALQATKAIGAELASKLDGLELTPEQLQAILALTREVIERVVWEVVPELAETIIREEIRRLTQPNAKN